MGTPSFQQLGLSAALEARCKEMGLLKPTEIQRRSIPVVLQGKNLVACAKTGSGKTAAFALPILQELGKDPYGVFAVVLTPTRELAFQIAEQFKALALSTLRVAVVVGGLDMLQQSLQLKQHPHICIATPGRLADHLRSAVEVRLKNLAYLIFDEADRLFDPCFEPDLQTILNALPPPSRRQTLFFSATLKTDDPKLLAYGGLLPDPDSLEAPCVVVQLQDETQKTVAQLDQKYIFIPQATKECYLCYILRQKTFEECSTIVFCSTTRGAEVVSQLLQELEIECVSLHSRLNQARRLASLGKFRSGRARVLVATDVASRGLDIPTVKLVINYDVPRLTEDYIHRVGRTARAGRGGVALCLVSQYDVTIFKAIETAIGMELTEYPLDERSVLETLKEVNQAKKMAKIRLEEFELTSRVVKRHRKEKTESEGADGSSHEPGQHTGQSRDIAFASPSAAHSTGQDSAAPTTKRKKKKRDTTAAQTQALPAQPMQAHNGQQKTKKKKRKPTGAMPQQAAGLVKKQQKKVKQKRTAPSDAQ